MKSKTKFQRYFRKALKYNQYPRRKCINPDAEKMRRLVELLEEAGALVVELEEYIGHVYTKDVTLYQKSVYNGEWGVKLSLATESTQAGDSTGKAKKGWFGR